MKPYRVARLADFDLDEIWLYIARKSVSAADRQLAKLHKTFQLIATHPDMGEQRPEFAGGDCRSFSAGSYVVYYRKFDGGVEVVRVVHGARDMGHA